MRKKHIRASGLFLAEILISILFFSLASVLCVRLFVQSHLMSSAANETEKAIEACASMAELMESVDSSEEFCTLLGSAYGINLNENRNFTLGYDGTYALTDIDKAEYLMIADLSEKSDTAKLDMKFIRTKDEAAIYTLSLEHHYPMEAADAD